MLTTAPLTLSSNPPRALGPRCAAIALVLLVASGSACDEGDLRYQQRSTPAPGASTTGDTNGTTPDDAQAWCPAEEPVGDPMHWGWRFVFIEDLSEILDDPSYPGVVIDAVELITQDGERHFATTVEDLNFGGGVAQDFYTILGPPDADCPSGAGVVALGGRALGGYILVGFSPWETEPDINVTFLKGSTLVLHTVDVNTCGTSTPNMRYAVGVVESTDGYRPTRIAEGTDASPICIDVSPEWP